ncbi:hypothetical protein TNCV_5062481 [Trichonephila clavipes]|nr:hypothetical protein TNCV_5062481 [Trichonephila clavipes]
MTLGQENGGAGERVAGPTDGDGSRLLPGPVIRAQCGTNSIKSLPDTRDVWDRNLRVVETRLGIMGAPPFLVSGKPWVVWP